MEDVARFIVSYYADGKHLWQDEYAPAVPAIGTGVHLAGVAYRIEDVWINHEKHAPVDHGIAVFLSRAERPRILRGSARLLHRRAGLTDVGTPEYR